MAGGGTGYSTGALVLALDADTTGQQQWRQLARQVALWGERVSVLESVAYGGRKMSAPRERRECWRSEPGLQRSPWEVRGSPCLSTSESPGLSGAPAFKRRTVRCAPRYLPSASPSASPVSGHAVRMARAARWEPPQQPSQAARGAAPLSLVLDRRLKMG
jgi:hypothetical protein